MKRSTDRILPTHTRGLPRPPDLLEQLLRRDRGEAVDADALGARVREAVADSVRRQAAAGVAVVNDGEAGRSGYSTDVAERREGFGGEGDPPRPPPDMLEFPEYLARERGDGRGPAMPACDGPIAYRDTAAARADIAALHEAVDGVEGVDEAFLSAASPGVAGRRGVLPRRPSLRRPRGVPRRDRGRDEGRVRRDPPRRPRAPAGLPGPHAHARPPGRRDRGPLPGAAAPACRGDQPRDARHPARRDADACVLG